MLTTDRGDVESVRDPRILIGLGMVQFAVAATLVPINWGHRWTPVWMLLLAALLGSAAAKIDAGALADTERRRRRSVALAHFLDATLFVVGYRAFVQLDTYPERAAGYALAGLAALVFVGIAVETARGTGPVPGSGVDAS